MHSLIQSLSLRHDGVKKRSIWIVKEESKFIVLAEVTESVAVDVIVLAAEQVTDLMRQ